MKSNFDDQPRLDEQESRLLDALLEYVSHPPESPTKARVNVLLDKIRLEEERCKTMDSGSSETEFSTTSNRRWPRSLFAPLAIAASVLVLMMVQGGLFNNAAYATLTRSIHAELAAVTKEYDVTVLRRNRWGGQREFRHALFVKLNMFAVRSPPIFGRESIWWGGSGNQRWLVPGKGAVLVGDHTLFRRKARETSTELPFLTVASTLQHIQRFYDISSDSHRSDELGPCDRVIAKLSAQSRLRLEGNEETNSPPPDRIEFFAAKGDGTVKQMTLWWNSDDESKAQRLSTTLRLVTTHDYPDEFFQHDAHHDAEREVKFNN